MAHIFVNVSMILFYFLNQKEWSYSETLRYICFVLFCMSTYFLKSFFFFFFFSFLACRANTCSKTAAIVTDPRQIKNDTAAFDEVHLKWVKSVVCVCSIYHREELIPLVSDVSVPEEKIISLKGSWKSFFTHRQTRKSPRMPRCSHDHSAMIVYLTMQVTPSLSGVWFLTFWMGIIQRFHDNPTWSALPVPSGRERLGS